MSPRAIWKGAVSFGMVAIPVKLYPATESKSLSFVSIHNTCHTRLQQKRWCSTHDLEVDNDEVGRAYEYTKDQFVIMEKSDFDQVQVPSTHTIEIKQFVDIGAIDPVHFERSYLLEPESVGQKPFYLLKRALEATGRVAIAKVSLRQKEHLCCVRPYEDAMILETMLYPDEIRGSDVLGLPADEVAVSDQEMAMATTLIDQLTGRFEPEQYHDEYRAALQQVIEARLGVSEPVVTAPSRPKGKVTDLMEALKASVEATKRSAAKRDGKSPAAKPRSRKKKTPAQSSA